jgi:hypothetical protein
VLGDEARGVERRVLEERAPALVQSVAFSWDGLSLGLTEFDFDRPTDILILDPETGAIRARPADRPHGVRAIAFSPEGRSLAAIGGGASIRLFDRQRLGRPADLPNGPLVDRRRYPDTPGLGPTARRARTHIGLPERRLAPPGILIQDREPRRAGPGRSRDG